MSSRTASITIVPKTPTCQFGQPNSEDWAGLFRTSAMEPSTSISSSVQWTRDSNAIHGPGGSSSPTIRIVTASCVIQRTTPGTMPTYTAPAVQDLIVNQLHIGAFYARDDQGNDIAAAGRPSSSMCW